MENIFDKNIVNASDDNLNSVLQTNRSLTENSLRMRAMAYLAQVKSSLLTQTIYEVDNDRKEISNYATSLDEKNKLLEEQKKLIEQQKIQIEKQQQQLIERQSKDGKIGHWTIDVSSDVITWSDEILRIYELIDNPDTVNIFTLKQKVHPDDIGLLVTSLEKVKKDPNYKHDLIYRIIKEDGSIVWIHCRGRLNSEKNTVEGTLQDITDLKNTEQELEKQKEILLSQSKSAMMGEMIGLIAHQFKQPLSTISMMAANQIASVELGDTILNDEIIHDAGETINQVEYLSSTIDMFRDFLKPDNEKVKANIKDVIENSIVIINKSLLNNEIELVKDYSSTQKVEVIHSELMQIFINLINNSKEAFNINNIKNRKISIKTYDESDNVIVEIEDNAGGIPADKIDNIFDAYFTTKKKLQGTGLGLYIVKTIIQEHFNGTIKVENTSNGAKFIITLHT